MSKEGIIKVDGTIIDALGNGVFRAELSNGHTITAYLSGKMRKNFIKILVGDDVEIEMSPYDLTKGRISYRRKS